MEPLQPFQFYWHHSGRLYLLLFVVNTWSTDKDKFPSLAVYVGRDEEKFAFWARPVEHFTEKFRPTDVKIPNYFSTFYNQLKQSWCRFTMLSGVKHG